MERTLYQSGAILQQVGQQVYRACSEYARYLEEGDQNGAKMDIQLFAYENANYMNNYNWQNTPDVGQSMVDYSQFVADVNNAVNAVGGQVEEFYSSLPDEESFGERAYRAIGKALGQFKEWTKSWYETAKKLFKDTTELIKTKSKEVWENTREFRQKCAKAIREFGVMTEKAFKAMGTKLKEVSLNCQKGLKKFKEDFKPKWEKFKTQLKTAGAKARTAIAGAVTTVVVASKKMIQNMKEQIARDKAERQEKRQARKEAKELQAAEPKAKKKDAKAKAQNEEQAPEEQAEQKATKKQKKLRVAASAIKKQTEEKPQQEEAHEEVKEAPNDIVQEEVQNDQGGQDFVQEIAELLISMGITNSEEAREIFERLIKVEEESRNGVNQILNSGELDNSNNEKQAGQIEVYVETLYPEMPKEEAEQAAEAIDEDGSHDSDSQSANA